jgi:hypothetical protein
MNEEKAVEEIEDEAEQQIRDIEEWIRNADQAGDLDEGIEARIRYIHTTEFSGRYDQSLIAFTWILGICEKNPELFEDHSWDILWTFKWIAGSLPLYPGVTIAQIEKNLELMQKMYEREAKSMRAVYSARLELARVTGNLAAIPALIKQWQESPQDGSEDCVACESDSLTALYLAAGELDKALKAGDGLIRGIEHCSHQPQVCQSSLLIPLFNAGNLELAAKLQLKSARHVKGKPDHMLSMAQHVAFLTATDQLTRALNMFESGLRQLPNVRRAWDNMHFLASGTLLFRRLAETGRKTVKLRAPRAYDFYRTDSTYPVQTLLQFCEQRVPTIVEPFDKRNGNNYISQMIKDIESLQSKVKPLKPRAASKAKEKEDA